MTVETGTAAATTATARGDGNGDGQGQGNCNGNGATQSVVITVSGQIIPLAGIDQVSLTLFDDGSATTGSTF